MCSIRLKEIQFKSTSELEEMENLIQSRKENQVQVHKYFINFVIPLFSTSISRLIKAIQSWSDYYSNQVFNGKSVLKLNYHNTNNVVTEVLVGFSALFYIKLSL